MPETNHSHRPRKQFGQNFLKDKSIIEKIVNAINPLPSQCLIEIGPGQGALTLPVLRRAGRLIAIEIDRDLIDRLSFAAESIGGDFHLWTQDALTVNFNELPINTPQFQLFGNLPYNISTPLLFHALSYAERISTMVFMLQKEVVQRMVASPGSKTYGRLSVMLQYHCRVQKLFDVNPQCFFPAPKVMSSVVKLVPHEPLPYLAHDTKLFAQLVREAFIHRRKTLHNGIKNLLSGHSLSDLGFDGQIRPECLSVADFVRLSNALHAARMAT